MRVADDTAHVGLRITHVTPGCPSEAAGARAGDRLVAVDCRAVNTVADYMAAKALVGDEYTLHVLRGNELLTLWVRR